MNDRIFEGKKFRFPLGARTYCMGILNVTPDSFSDGGAYIEPDDAARHALDMQQAGADLLDVGAESTRPGHVPVDAAAEIARLLPILPRLCETLQIPVSVDTRHPETAAWALENGAAVINDVSGTLSRETAAAVKAFDAGWIVMHGADADDAPQGDPTERVRRFFAYAMDVAASFGIAPSRLCLDPGIGFGKSRDGDFAVLRRLSALQTPCALLVGASRKRLIGEASGEGDPLRRLPGTIACHTAAVAGGADILRVHDVAEAVQAMRVADAIYRRADRPAASGTILLRDLRVFAHHGVHPEEKEFGQTFLLDADLDTDFSAAIAKDSIADTVSYAAVAKTLRRVLTAADYDLIEHAAQEAVNAVLDEYPSVRRIRLRLKKPDAPMQSACRYAAVEIEKERS